MSPPRFDHRKLIHDIMELGEVQQTINHILRICKDDPAGRVGKVFQNIRMRILRRPEYSRPEAISELRALANGPEKIRVLALLQQPVHTMHNAQRKDNFFSDEATQNAFKEIRFMKDPFYEFDTPYHIKHQARNYVQEVANEHHHHRRRAQQFYHFTETEVNEMIATATDYIQSEQQWMKRTPSCKLLDCLSLVSGRRKWELASTLKVRSVTDRPYQASITGLGKNTLYNLVDEEWHTIPLLIPIEIFVKGISNLRRYPHESGKYSYDPPLFPKMNHTAYRNLFSLWAYRNRHINRFHENDSCSELAWRADAVCVAVSTLGSHYSTLLVSDDEPIDEQHPGGEVSCKAQESKERMVCQDIV